MNTENTPSTTPEVVKKEKNNNDNLIVRNDITGKKKGKRPGNGKVSNYLTISSIDGKVIKKVARKEAEKAVKSGGYIFCPRKLWKKAVRDIRSLESVQIVADEKHNEVIVKKSKQKNDKPRKSKEHKDAKET